MHQPYEQTLGHSADFRVKYIVYSKEQGGRNSGPPNQGIRSDVTFLDQKEKGLHRIWPEFEDLDFKVITHKNPVPSSGTALMWIVHPKMRVFHRENIQIGMKGFFREGGKITAEFEVIELIGLYSNPTE